jgi:hypothetical protein
MHSRGQQVPQLWATVGVQLTRNTRGVNLQLLLWGQDRWCLGAGGGPLRDVSANTEVQFTSASMSKAETDPTGICQLPYTTTALEVHVRDASGEVLIVSRFPATYNFIAP